MMDELTYEIGDFLSVDFLSAKKVLEKLISMTVEGGEMEEHKAVEFIHESYEKDPDSFLYHC